MKSAIQTLALVGASLFCLHTGHTCFAIAFLVLVAISL